MDGDIFFSFDQMMQATALNVRIYLRKSSEKKFYNMVLLSIKCLIL